MAAAASTQGTARGTMHGSWLPVTAIFSGTIVCMAAMLDGMVQRIEADLGSPATLILTGGAARFFEPLVLHPHIYDPNLLLKGLAFLCERNCAN